MPAIPRSEVLAKFFEEIGEKCGEILAKFFADFRPSISRENGNFGGLGAQECLLSRNRDGLATTRTMIFKKKAYT